METINLDTAEYGAIIRFAEAHGFRKSSAAVAREAEEGSVGQYGLTLDEACDFIRANGLNSEMPISIAAATLGARGGAATKGVSTPHKARTSRANGKLGGRPNLPEAKIRAAIWAEGLRPIRHGRRVGMDVVSALRADGTAAFFVHPTGNRISVDASMANSDREAAIRVAAALQCDLLTE